MSEFQTPVKKPKDPSASENITIPPSPFLQKLGYGTGVSVMQLVRSPKAGQIRSPWALKMLNKRVKQHPVFSERLQEEAALLQRMSHPNVVGFRAFGKGKILYLGMEACDLSLGDLIEKKVEEDCEPFAPLKILKVAEDISSALDYIHTKIMILHGDMKSYNVLVNGDFNICKLCDFGVTLPLDENGLFNKEKAGNAVYYGTEAWSAPEVIHGGALGWQADVWALGLTLWEMLALTPPHSPLDAGDSLADDSVASDASAASEDYFCDKYGTRPAIPANVPLREYSQPLALFLVCTEQQPAARPPPRTLAGAAAAMARESRGPPLVSRPDDKEMEGM